MTSFQIESGASNEARNGAAEIWALATAARDGVMPAPIELARAVIDEALDQVGPSALLVAGDGTGVIAGFAALHLAGNAAQLTYLGVHPQSWGRGIATALLKGVEEEAARAGLTSIQLLVYVDNLAAVRSYERAGWSVVGDPRPHPRTGRLEQRYERVLGGQFRRR